MADAPACRLWNSDDDAAEIIRSFTGFAAGKVLDVNEHFHREADGTIRRYHGSPGLCPMFGARPKATKSDGTK